MDSWFRDFKRSATPTQLYAFLHAMPKGGDLHHHLTGSGYPQWWYALATDKDSNGGYEYYTRVSPSLCQGLSPDTFGPDNPFMLFRTVQASTWRRLPDCEKTHYRSLSALSDEQKAAFLNSVRLDKQHEGRNEFFETHWQRLNELTRNPYIVGQLLVKNMQAYQTENVRYLETQVNVHGMMDATGSPLSAETALSILLEALNSPTAKATGVTVKFQYALLRFLPNAEEQLATIYAFVDGHRKDYVGINMVGREDNDKGHPLRFLPALRMLRHKYPAIPLAFHAGEVDEPNHHVRDTLLLGADRIGHGLNTITDPETLLLMRHGPYLIEINLISNLLLEYVEDFQSHPFGEYLRLGIPVALSTDDRGMWGATLTDEFYVAVRAFNLSWTELRTLTENSIEYSFLAKPQKYALKSSLSASLDEFEDKAPQSNFISVSVPTDRFICRREPSLCSAPKE
ncbi:adenosine deaminase [Aestuariibacter sp. A3R04]|uniref:adenosine deaminase family protein n=1 Tax=Aestuariibacter sp. A3R04 TaxID=2841571 RepID=UPI001C0A446B|nr:adenosine deaminase [Aestuariibacter sp. A3R04]MBU3022635.1 adenosine deaminase [Aestuariibacter sp. A3R04]